MSLEIKNSIAILCKLLNLLYKTNLKPEYFRLAKFNKSEEHVVPALWDALVKLTRTSSITDIEIIMRDINYKRSKFYACIIANEFQSRELLFALTYFLTLNLRVNVMHEIKNSVFSEYYIHICQDFIFTYDINPNELENFTDRDLGNYKRWLEGKIAVNQNLLFEYKNQINHIQTKLNTKLNIKAQDSLTIYELLAIMNKKIAQSFNKNSEFILDVLNVYTGWLKKEKIFWKWMESVLIEEKQVESQILSK